MKESIRLLLLGSFFVLSACGSENGNQQRQSDDQSKVSSSSSQQNSNSKKVFEKDDNLQFDGASFLVKEGQLTLENGSLEGSATLIATLASITADTHFEISIDLGSSGSAQFFAFANSQIEEGIVLTILQNETRLEGPDDKITIDTGASSLRNYSLDIHNSEDPTHILVWNKLNISRSTPALVDTAEDGFDIGTAQGNLYGIKLNKAKVLKLKRKKAVSSH